MTEIEYMRRAFALAKSVRGTTLPNPAVGAVIVKDGQIIGEGATCPAGGNHAEIEALNQAGEKARGADLYVTLEPCSHYGRTPPCSLAVIRAGLAKVIVAVKDPNPLVAGKGIQMLKEKGVQVKEGVFEDFANEFYAGFFLFVTKQRPKIILKMAVSADGFIAGTRGEPKKITGLETAHWTHELRDRCDAIMVSGRTARHDNPLLDCRLKSDGKNPARVVFWNKTVLPENLQIFRKDRTRVLIFGPKGISWLDERAAQIQVASESFPEFLRKVIEELGKRGFHQVLVECGAELLGAFMELGVWDEFFLLHSPKKLESGILWDTHLSKSWNSSVEISTFGRVGEDRIERICKKPK